MSNKDLLENHICRFNDGECECECYKEALQAQNDLIMEMIENILNGVS